MFAKATCSLRAGTCPKKGSSSGFGYVAARACFFALRTARTHAGNTPGKARPRVDQGATARDAAIVPCSALVVRREHFYDCPKVVVSITECNLDLSWCVRAVLCVRPGDVLYGEEYALHYGLALSKRRKLGLNIAIPRN